ACVGGGSTAAGLFAAFADEPTVRLIGVEPAGGAAVGHGAPAIVHGMKAFFLQDEVGQVIEAESISAGLDYPGIGPEHSYLSVTGRAEYHPVTDDQVVAAFGMLARKEGIIAALESAHALAWVVQEKEQLAGQTVLINLSGRGDKDVAQIQERLEK
ncbi:MAG: pyridoxal-phosphate dependent enzyme, partial [Actinomycetota bacterium]|nr:pyridoxal-phosphate dependent enzyme [Actinomycetota bacterium]